MPSCKRGTTVSGGILRFLAIPLNLSQEWNKMEQTKEAYFTLLYAGSTSTDQHTVSNLVGFLAVSRVNKSASTFVPFPKKCPQFCQWFESSGVGRYYLKNWFHMYNKHPLFQAHIYLHCFLKASLWQNKRMISFKKIFFLMINVGIIYFDKEKTLAY